MLDPSQTGEEMKLEEVTNRILDCSHKFIEDYGINPFDVCLGPEEFNLIYNEGRNKDTTPDWHYEAAPMFYKGMRIRLTNAPGVLVGCLTAKYKGMEKLDLTEIPRVTPRP